MQVAHGSDTHHARERSHRIELPGCDANGDGVSHMAHARQFNGSQPLQFKPHGLLLRLDVLTALVRFGRIV